MRLFRKIQNNEIGNQNNSEESENSQSDDDEDSESLNESGQDSDEDEGEGEAHGENGSRENETFQFQNRITVQNRSCSNNFIEAFEKSNDDDEDDLRHNDIIRELRLTIGSNEIPRFDCAQKINLAVRKSVQSSEYLRNIANLR